MDEYDDSHHRGGGYQRYRTDDGPTSVRRHFTTFNSFDNFFHNKLMHGNNIRERSLLQPHFNYLKYVTLPVDNRFQSSDGVCAHYLLHGINRKNKSAINCGAWGPDGNRLIVGTDSGILTLWEAETFKYEKLVTTHKTAIRVMKFSNLGRVLLTGDNVGNITYFGYNLRNIRIIPNAHNENPVRGVAFSPTDTKFVSCGDDSSVKIWDWETATCEQMYSDHLADVRCCDWHPFRSLVVSGSKDNTIRLWDPRMAESLASVYLHKSAIFCCKFNPINGNTIATGSKDFNVKLFDIRMMKEMECYKGHNREIVTVNWHPIHEHILVSGAYQGSMIYWHVGHPGPHTIVTNAHNYSVNMLQYHPLGHVLASAANDGIVKFWAREPPGSKCETLEFTGTRGGGDMTQQQNHESLVIGHGPYVLDSNNTSATMNSIYVKEAVGVNATANAAPATTQVISSGTPTPVHAGSDVSSEPISSSNSTSNDSRTNVNSNASVSLALPPMVPNNTADGEQKNKPNQIHHQQRNSTHKSDEPSYYGKSTNDGNYYGGNNTNTIRVDPPQSDPEPPTAGTRKKSRFN